VLYVLAPVLVHVLLDGSGHDSAEIDGTVERHNSSTSTKQPVPAPRQSSVIRTSAITSDLKLDLMNSSLQKNTQKQWNLSESNKLTDKYSNEKENLIIDNKLTEEIVSDGNMRSKVPEKKEILEDNMLNYSDLYESDKHKLLSNQDNRLNDVIDPCNKVSSHTVKSTTMERMEHTFDFDGTRDPNVDTVLNKSVTETITTKYSVDEKQESWRTMSSSGEASIPAELWEIQFPLDDSPISYNEDVYAKNGSIQGTISDTDSDGSSHHRRKSPNKRCTFGSSSGSDVALHEGAELSPLEDDQGTSLTANVLSKQCTCR
jgi:hypothetical protein